MRLPLVVGAVSVLKRTGGTGKSSSTRWAMVKSLFCVMFAFVLFVMCTIGTNATDGGCCTNTHCTPNNNFTTFTYHHSTQYRRPGLLRPGTRNVLWATSSYGNVDPSIVDTRWTLLLLCTTSRATTWDTKCVLKYVHCTMVFACYMRMCVMSSSKACPSQSSDIKHHMLTFILFFSCYFSTRQGPEVQEQTRAALRGAN